MSDYKNMLTDMSNIFKIIEKEHPFYRLDKGQLDCKSPNTIKFIEEYISKNPTLGYKSELTQLKDFIILYLKDSRSVEYKKEEIGLVNGCIEGLFVALYALKNKKQNILIPEPCWPAYYKMATDLGYNNKNYDFLDYADIDKLIETLNQEEVDDTYILLINSPHNPTGIIIEYEKMKQIVAICNEKNITIVSDEVYYEYSSETKKSVSPIEVSNKKDNIIIVSSFSKNLSMPGYRIGFIGAGEERIKEFNEVHKMITGGISPVTQIAVAGLGMSYKDNIQFNTRKVGERRKIATNILSNEKLVYDVGGIYLFLNCNRNSEQVCKNLLRNGIACVPGTCMGKNCENYIRVGLIMEKEYIKEACEKIKKIIYD